MSKKKPAILLSSVLLLPLLILSVSAVPVYQSVHGFSSALLDASFNLTGDITFEIANDGFYSKRVFEGYVENPNAKVKVYAQIDLDTTLLSILQVRSKHTLTLGEAKLGIQFFLSSRYFDNMCFMNYIAYELLSLQNSLRTNGLTCENDMYDHLTEPEFIHRSHRLHTCQFKEDTWQHPNIDFLDMLLQPQL